MINKYSILMTAYNRESFIAEAIESVLKQTITEFELIIVDDCSTDKTAEIVHEYAKKDSRIKLHLNENNLGDYPNRNRAASFADGEFLVYVDSDDTINKDALEYIDKAFAEHQLAKHSTIYYKNDYIAPSLVDSKTAINRHLSENNMLSTGPGARVFRRTFFNEIGGFPTKYGPANDMFFNILTTVHAPILVLPYAYLNYRIHDHQENKNQFKYLYNGYRYFEDMLNIEELPLSKSQIVFYKKKNKRRFLINIIKFYFKTKNIRQVKEAIRLANFSFSDFFIAIFQI